MEGRHRDFTLPLFFILLFAAAVAFAARDLDSANNQFPAPAGRQAGTYYGYGGPGNIGGFYGAPGGGPGGWGAGYGGVEVPTVVCQEKGPCYGKKVTCPKTCFWSYSRAGNGYGAGGGGGSCTVDCKNECTATC
jgi:hypothetical protein